MVEENLERLRAWLGTWDLEAMSRGQVDLSLVDPDVTYQDEILPDHIGEVYRGRGALVHAAQVWIAPYETFRVDLEQIQAAGECVVASYRFRAKARHSGIEFDEPVAWLFAFRDGKIIRWQAYRAVDEAIDAGLAE